MYWNNDDLISVYSQIGSGRAYLNTNLISPQILPLTICRLHLYVYLIHKYCKSKVQIWPAWGTPKNRFNLCISISAKVVHHNNVVRRKILMLCRAERKWFVSMSGQYSSFGQKLFWDHQHCHQTSPGKACLMFDFHCNINTLNINSSYQLIKLTRAALVLRWWMARPPHLVCLWQQSTLTMANPFYMRLFEAIQVWVRSRDNAF